MPVVTHDLIVLSEVDTDNIPGSVVSKIKERVQEGATLIVTAQDDLEALDIDDILPVTFASDPVVSKKVDVDMQNVLTAVTQGVSITSVDKYLQATAKEKSVILAKTSEGVPLLAMGSYGEGTVVFYGIFESNSTFKYDVSYPIFWQQLIDYVIGKETIETLNYKISEKVVFDTEIPVLSPSGKEETVDSLEFDEIGIYEYQNKKVAVNLLSPVESNVAYLNEAYELREEDGEGETMKIKSPLTKHFIVALLVLLFLELLYVKARGDF